MAEGRDAARLHFIRPRGIMRVEFGEVALQFLGTHERLTLARNSGADLAWRLSPDAKTMQNGK